MAIRFYPGTILVYHNLQLSYMACIESYNPENNFLTINNNVIE
jgi:hypothetical protein